MKFCHCFFHNMSSTSNGTETIMYSKLMITVDIIFSLPNWDNCCSPNNIIWSQWPKRGKVIPLDKTHLAGQERRADVQISQIISYKVSSLQYSSSAINQSRPHKAVLKHRKDSSAFWSLFKAFSTFNCHKDLSHDSRDFGISGHCKISIHLYDHSFRYRFRCT